MLRTPWFWITIAIIALGVVLAATLGVFYWLVGAFVATILLLATAFLVAAYAVKRVKPPQTPHLGKIPRSEQISVIYDCDLTMGRPFRDVGDGLALLYLLGEPRVHLRFVTTTYGDGPVEMTTRATRRLLDSLGCDDVAVFPGVSGPDDDPATNRAARQLKGLVALEPGKIVLIAAGSMTNLKHAVALDPDFFKKLRGLYILGGVTGPLIWNGHRLAERNFSLDPEAAYLALHAECPVTVTPGQAGLTAIFRGPQLAALQALDDSISRLIVRKIRLWFALARVWFRDGGFGMWDSIPVLALTHPELFETEQVYITSTRDELRAGRLCVDPSRHGPTRLVRGVRDFDRFITAHFAAWHHFGRTIDAKRSEHV